MFEIFKRPKRAEEMPEAKSQAEGRVDESKFRQEGEPLIPSEMPDQPVGEGSPEIQSLAENWDKDKEIFKDRRSKIVGD